MLLRRDGGPGVIGSLTLLHAFATIQTQSRAVRVPRGQIGLILLNRSLIPLGAAVLPLDSDAVLLTDGREKVVGRVEVDGEVIRVGARSFQQSQVSVIRLADAKAGQGAQSATSNTPGAPSAGGPPTGSGNPANAGASGQAGGRGRGGSPRPRSSSEIPWGQALWRGVLRFEHVISSLGERASGSYYVTWAESTVAGGGIVAAVTLKPVSLVYNYQLTVPEIGSCKPFTLIKNGSGIDGRHPEIPSGAIFTLPLPGAPAGYNAGGYHVNLFSPAFIPPDEWPKTCSTGGPLTTLRNEGDDMSSFSFGQTYTGPGPCTPDDSTFRVPPPYVTIAGTKTCGVPGEYGYVSLRWQFDRGIPPPDVSIDQKPCATPEALLSLSRDQRAAAVARLKQIAAEFAAAGQNEERLRGQRDQLQFAFDMMLVASLSSDVGRRLLEIVISDGMLKTAAATGQITAAQREFITSLKGFIKSYEAWTEFADDPSGWGQSKMLGGAREGLGDANELIDGAMQMFNYGQVLADAIGQGDGSAALEYIEDNMAVFGPLIPEYSLNKARQYVEVSQQWSGEIKKMARLSAEGANLAAKIAEADLGIAVRQKALDDCKQAHPS